MPALDVYSAQLCPIRVMSTSKSAQREFVLELFEGPLSVDFGFVSRGVQVR